MLVDVFLWNGELDMARLRVDALRDRVDRMVAVSCTLTHQSEKAEQVPPPDGCEWLIAPATPIPEGRGGVGNPYYQWIERQHRDGIAALERSADDVVMVSDVDEIPDPDTLPDIQDAAEVCPVSVPMRMHGFALNFLYPLPWRGTTASTGALLAPQAHRNWRHKLPPAGAGWHLSWFGDLDEKRRKLRSFSHAELSGLDVEDCYRTGTHANGERMTVLTNEAVMSLRWPEPLLNHPIPESWWAPEA